MIPGAFTYKGIKSTAFNIISRSNNRSLLPPVNQRAVSIYGKDGVIDFGNNTYGNRPIDMHIAFIGSSFLELRTKAREISSWLTSDKYEKLVFDDEPDKYYLARIYDPVGLSNFARLGETDITFDCLPFAFNLINSGYNLTLDEADFPLNVSIAIGLIDAYSFSAQSQKSFQFFCPGTKEISYMSQDGSLFNIVISGSWTDLNISMNGKQLDYLESGSGELIINNVDMEVELNGANKLDVVEGDIDTFLNLLHGDNTITISGTSLDVSVLVDFIALWV